MVMGTASPDDPALDWYWASPRRKAYSQFGGRTASLLLRQRGLCPACGTLLPHADHGPQSPQQWEQWTLTLTTALRKSAIVPRIRPTATIRPPASCTPTANSVNRDNGNGSSNNRTDALGARLSRIR